MGKLALSSNRTMVSVDSTYDLESVSDNADSHELLSVVATVHHQGVGETLNDGAVGLAESLLGVTTSGVGGVDWGSDLNVIAARKRMLAMFRGGVVSYRIQCALPHCRLLAAFNSLQLPFLMPFLPFICYSYSQSPPPLFSPSATVEWVSLRQGDVADLDILITPLVEQLDAAHLLDNILGECCVNLAGDLALGGRVLIDVRHGEDG